MEYLTHSLEETQKIAKDFVINLGESKNGATVVGLYGELGSGKTSFSQGVARALGISENVVSPTFVIEKIYELPIEGRPYQRLIHIDAYRIENSAELLHLGWHDIVSNSGNLILVEWPERISDIMPEHIEVKFEHISENERKIEIK